MKENQGKNSEKHQKIKGYGGGKKNPGRSKMFLVVARETKESDDIGDQRGKSFKESTLCTYN